LKPEEISENKATININLVLATSFDLVPLVWCTLLSKAEAAASHCSLAPLR
jgi:hypothetical protein